MRTNGNVKTLFMETTKIDAGQTVGEIQRILGGYGATAIMTEYEKGEVAAVSFTVCIGGNDVPFRLPCRYEAVHKFMMARMKKFREKRFDEYRAQSKRVAWRQVLRWIQAQMALVETEMVTMQEVFLPYMRSKNGKTLYEMMEQNSFKMLEHKP